jgi:hypothetical protein
MLKSRENGDKLSITHVAVRKPSYQQNRQRYALAAVRVSVKWYTRASLTPISGPKRA